MKIDTTTTISAKLTFNKNTYPGIISFTSDGMRFKPHQISHKTPEVKIDYTDFKDMFVGTTLSLSSSITIMDKLNHRYKFSTWRTRAIRKYLDNKF
ncbi:MAG: hypothetical protein R3Y09_07225 [Clostridia bacterium]